MAEIKLEKVERPLATLSLGTGPLNSRRHRRQAYSGGLVGDARLISRSYCAASRLARWKAPSFPTALRS